MGRSKLKSGWMEEDKLCVFLVIVVNTEYRPERGEREGGGRRGEMRILN